MFTTDDIKKTAAKFDELISKRPRPRDPSDSPVAYQNLSVVKKLGKAKFPVYLTSSKVDKQNYAMKVFSHQGEKPHPYFKNEVRFSNLKHPNVINMVHYENDRDTLQKGEVKRVSYILMEYAPHGDFFDFISKKGEQFDEKLIRTFFRQLVDGIEYLHENGIDLKHPFAADIYSAGIILFILKSGGIYPHSEDAAFEGLNLADLMHNKNEEFWKKHLEIQGRKKDFFDSDFKELFNAMTKYNAEDRMSLKEIKQSKWYNGAVYTPFDFERKMKQILKC